MNGCLCFPHPLRCGDEGFGSGGRSGVFTFFCPPEFDGRQAQGVRFSTAAGDHAPA